MPFFLVIAISMLVAVLLTVLYPLDSISKRISRKPDATKIEKVFSERKIRKSFDDGKYTRKRPDARRIAGRPSNLRDDPVTNAEAALIRTCRTLDILGRVNGCAWKNDPDKIWKFLTKSENVKTGSLSDIGEGRTTDSFSCFDYEAYGRFLARNSLPKKSYGLRYDLRGMDGEKDLDPCGYTEFVTR